ncbi:MAG: RDD family protein [Candidatus Acidiferrales bacterium]
MGRQMYCSKCGTQLPVGSAFCNTCGNPTGDSPAAAIEPPLGLGGGALPANSAPSSVRPYDSLPLAAYAIPLSAYAGFWLRFLAYAIDGVLMGIVFGILVLLWVAIVGIDYFRAMFEDFRGDNPEFPVALIGAILLLSVASTLGTWLYHAWMESSQYQGTLGKMALGLTVTDLQGRRVGFGRATGRFFAKIITGLVPFGVGYMMAGFTEKKQALHDMIANCLVLRKTLP